ncbi:hypothetical protein SDC9_87577 [bioreactor metagenome]|uniref:Uncharacterized protein n=1 Tax=bioreactor metagenome TaxID=1076179 RepID=A0A644ZKR3_9ZZZZ
MSTNWTAQADDTFLNERKQALQFGVLKLVSWPDLNVVPQQHQAVVARICALLTRKPSAGHLIPLILAAPEREVLQDIANLVRMGHVAVATLAFADPAAQQADTSTAAPVQERKPVESSFRRSLVSKLWARLTASA